MVPCSHPCCLRSCLPVTRMASGENLDLETLHTVLEEELVARERSRDPSWNNRPPREKHQPLPTATTLLSGTQESSGKSTVCSYCQQTHSPVDSHVVTNPDARRQILKKSGRCFNCLMKGHVGKRCRSFPQYQTCKRRHYLSICSQTAAAEPRSPPSSTEPTV